MKFLMIWLAFSTLAVSAHGADLANAFRVRSVSGTVLTRAPNSARWKSLRQGAEVPRGQLVQVAPGGHLSLRSPTRESQGEVDLVINTPMIFRVGPEMMRKVTLTRHFIDKLPQMALEAANDTKQPLFLDEAWRKTAAIFTKSGMEKPAGAADMGDLERQGMALGMAAKRLNILVPATNSLVESDTFPAPVKVAWSKAKDPSTEYKVYVWEASKSQGAPAAVTRDDHHTLSIAKPGTYFVQVASASGGWQSGAHVVHVMRPSYFASGENKGGLAGAVEVAVTLDFPPHSYTVQTTQPSAVSLGFYWHQNAAKGKETFVLESRSGVQRIAAVSGYAGELRLSPGEYTWYVEIQPSGSPNPTKSEVRKLSVRGVHGNFVKSLLEKNQSGTFYLADGL